MWNNVRQLSTNWTAFHKILLPLLWLALFGYWALTPFLDKAIPLSPHTGDQWFLVMFFLVSTFFILQLAVQIKYVDLAGSELVVRGYTKTIRIPLKDVGRVWGGGRQRSRTIGAALIRFETLVPTEFGNKIVFMPTVRIGYGEHPIVQELSVLVNEAKGVKA
jgi:hypothetical protein